MYGPATNISYDVHQAAAFLNLATNYSVNWKGNNDASWKLYTWRILTFS